MLLFFFLIIKKGFIEQQNIIQYGQQPYKKGDKTL